MDKSRVLTKLLPCSKCEKTFRDNHGLRRHLKSHISPIDTPKNIPQVSGVKMKKNDSLNADFCGKCNKNFSNKWSFARHWSSFHKNDGDKAESRVENGKTAVNQVTAGLTKSVISSSSDDLDNQSSNYFNKKEQNLAIDAAEGRQGNNSQYRNSEYYPISRSENKEDKRYENTLSSQGSLMCSCKQCGEKLRDKWALKRHMAKHSFNANIGKSEAAQRAKENMADNLNTVHAPANIHRSSKEEFVNQIILQNGDSNLNQYNKCQLCGFMFVNMNKLNEHMKTSHMNPESVLPSKFYKDPSVTHSPVGIGSKVSRCDTIVRPAQTPVFNQCGVDEMMTNMTVSTPIYMTSPPPPIYSVSSVSGQTNLVGVNPPVSLPKVCPTSMMNTVQTSSITDSSISAVSTVQAADIKTNTIQDAVMTNSIEPSVMTARAQLAENQRCLPTTSVDWVPIVTTSVSQASPPNVRVPASPALMEKLNKMNNIIRLIQKLAE